MSESNFKPILGKGKEEKVYGKMEGKKKKGKKGERRGKGGREGKVKPLPNKNSGYGLDRILY